MAFPRSGTVDTQTISGTKDFMFVHSSAVQSANVGVGDHLKLNTIDVARGGATTTAGAASGGMVVLDTTTTYVNTLGAASLGRFTLRGGRVYRLESSAASILFSGATGVLTLQWFDVTVLGAGVAIGQPASVFAQTDASNDGATGDLVALFSPGGGAQDKFLVEVQIIAVTALTNIGNTSTGLPYALVETF